MTTQKKHDTSKTPRRSTPLFTDSSTLNSAMQMLYRLLTLTGKAYIYDARSLKMPNASNHLSLKEL